MKKFGLVAMGVLLTGFGIAQTLQIMGFIGMKAFSIPGLSFAILGLTLGGVCFHKAFQKEA